MLKFTQSKDKIFSLFLRTREAEAIQQVVQHIDSLPEELRAVWLKENSEVLYQAFENFIESSSETLTNINFEDEALSLSEQLVFTLQETSRKLDAMLSNAEEEPQLKA